MKINEILQEENILLDLEAETKEEAIKQLADLLYKSERVMDLKLFLTDVFNRESLGFTGAGKGIAIPHGISEAVNDVTIVVGKTRQPVYWDTGDEIDEEEKKVSLIILFAVPAGDVFKESRKHIEALKLVMEKLADYETLQRLLQAGDEKEIIDILANETTKERREFYG